MQANVRNRFRFGKSPVSSTGKYFLPACLPAFILACATCGMAQTAIALPVAAQTETAQSGVVPTKAMQPEVAHSGVARTETVQPATAQSGVAATVTVKPRVAQSAVAHTGAVQSITAQSGVAQAGTLQPAAAKPGVAAVQAAQPPANPPGAAHASSPPAQPAQPVVAIDRPPKKKIVFTQFDVADILQVNDINNIYDGLPAALSSRMESGTGFLSTASRYSIPAGGETTRQQAIVQIAGETGAQFLIAGTVVDAGTDRGTRHIEIELNVYDGFSGTALLSRRYEDQTDGDVRVGDDIPFGSRAFFDTDYGSAISRVIDTAVKGIRVALKNVPFAAHIVRAEGKKVLLDAGSNSLLKPGYQLVAYTNEPNNPVNDLLGAKLGDVEHPADMITLTDVQPQFSIGQLSHDAAILGINAGNTAGINNADRRYLAEHPADIPKIIAARQQAQAKWVNEHQAAKAPSPAVAKTKMPGAKQKSRIARVREKRKTRIARTRAKKKSRGIVLAKSSPCDQLAALRAACEKKSPATLKAPDSKI